MTTQLTNTTLELRDRLPLLGVQLPFALKRRDPREPGRRKKEELEDRMYRAFLTHFRKQRRAIREKLLYLAPERKSLFGYDLDYYMTHFGDDFWVDDEFKAKVMRILTVAGTNGVEMFGDNIGLEMDYTQVNEEVAKWATSHADELFGQITGTSQDLLGSAIADFVRTPGMTIGDVITRLPVEHRSLRTAVTEITRAYATAEQIAGDAISAEYPNVLVIKKWYTNNDDRVCDICGPLDGKAVPIDQFFPTIMGDVDQPPAHVNCRCWMSSQTRISGELKDSEKI